MTRVNPLTLSDSQYAKKAIHYIEMLNSLRRLGAHHAVDLPTVVFCGNQSAGKSSLLEAISDVQLPRSDGTCTRCVMEIRLMDSKNRWECQIKLRKEYDNNDDKKLSRPEEFKFGDIIIDKANVELMARRAQKALLNPTRNWTEYLNWTFSTSNEVDARQNEIKFTKNVVCLEIKGPKVPNLSLIDLPGIIRHTENKQDEKFITIIQDLVEYYIGKEKSIIIATISCKDEIDNQAIVGLARKVDEFGIRTLGVLTKPDTIEVGAENQWLKIMCGEAHKLELGYYIVRNPPPKELQRGITFEEARKAEKEFFAGSCTWHHSHLQPRIGVEKLRGKLSELLIKAIERGLPSIKKDVEDQLNKARSELEELPDPISENSRVELYRLAKKCATMIKEQTTCSNNKMSLWQEINEELKSFKIELCSTRPIFVVGKNKGKHGLDDAKFDVLKEFVDPGNVDPRKLEENKHDFSRKETEKLQEITEADIRRTIMIAKGRLLPGFIPYSSALMLIRDFQKNWKTPACHCLNNIHHIMSRLVDKSIQETFGRFPMLIGIMKQNAMIWLDTCKNETNKRLEFNVLMENSYPFTLDEGTMSKGKLTYLAALQEAVQIDGDRQPSDYLEVIAAVMAYFKLSFKRFVDSVAMTIAYAFVDEYPKLIEEKLLAQIIEGENGKVMDVNELIAEDSSIAVAREELLQREKHMRELLNDLVRFGI
ncbi:10797_t:CDS:2 [Ambispora gerdemannii]|uniref:10797_t:CDS:1 n=1 Tax=Ambispora gerdemannii TaxID=144530 RepID=A0A9N8WGF0_9GLOM|nr:10797_t:CDS:2 [Ambispora gerdemannii]